MGFRRLDTLTSVANKGFWVKLECPCGHVNMQNPMVILELVLRRGGSSRLNRLHESMKCGKCGGKDFTATHCGAPAIWKG